jgi:CubicO group peptidase (beta-lactamase class C family)
MHIDLSAFVRSVEKNRLDLSGITVKSRSGTLARHMWEHDERINVRSVAKSVTSLAVGMAVQEGIISLEETVAQALREYLPDNAPGRLEDIKIRHLLTMTTGHAKGLLRRDMRDNVDDWLLHVLSQPVDYYPGERFVYNNAATYLVGALISIRTGMRLVDWLRPRLFEPLGIKNPQWFSCPSGRAICMGGLFLSNDELARLSLLCLGEGEFEGQRLVGAEWIREASALQKSTSFELGRGKWANAGDYTSGYCFWFWRNKTEGYRMDGRFGNFGIVLPGHDCVIAVTGRSEKRPQKLLNCIWEEILPLLERRR